MEIQKTANLLNNSYNESSKSVTKSGMSFTIYRNATDYGEGNENDTSIKFETKNVKSSLCNYLVSYILVTGDMTATSGDENTNVALKTVYHLQNV